MSGYQPPSGPPPGYQAPSGSSSSQYQPPPGPPPGYHTGSSSSEYQPPPGPPPGKFPSPNEAPPDDPPPYHDWTIIPDTSLLPPPPGVSNAFSSGANATKEESDRAMAWCAAYPLWTPRVVTHQQLQSIHQGRHTLVKSQPYVGDLLPDNPAPGIWKCRTWSGCKDALVQTDLPIYSAPADSPMVTERSKTIYFELKVLGLGRAGPPPAPEKKHHGFSLSKLKHREPEPENEEAGIGIGFFAPPYPPFRLPGWQRGSLGVHSDDGRRYMNDTHGGLDFTKPFKVNETVGIGITFKIPSNPPAYGEPGNILDAEAFFTRDGKKVGEWNIHEEQDLEQDEGYQGVQGLEGNYDLFPAVGVFGGCDFEVRFQEKDWLYRPPI